MVLYNEVFQKPQEYGDVVSSAVAYFLDHSLSIHKGLIGKPANKPSLDQLILKLKDASLPIDSEQDLRIFVKELTIYLFMSRKR